MSDCNTPELFVFACEEMMEKAAAIGEALDQIRDETGQNINPAQAAEFLQV